MRTLTRPGLRCTVVEFSVIAVLVASCGPGNDTQVEGGSSDPAGSTTIEPTASDQESETSEEDESAVEIDAYPDGVAIDGAVSAALIDGHIVDSFQPIGRTAGDDLIFAIVNVFEPDIRVEVSLRQVPSFTPVEFESYLDLDVEDDFQTVVEGLVAIPADVAPGVHRLHFEALGGTTQRSIELYVEVPGQPVGCHSYGMLVGGLESFEYATISYDGVEFGGVEADFAGSALLNVFVPATGGMVTITLNGERTGELPSIALDAVPGTCDL